MMRLFSKILAFGVAVVCAGVASGQDWPAKQPIRINTGSAGGGSDFVARLIAQGISGPLGQSVVVNNMTSGFVPGLATAQAAPDGYTIILYGATLYLETLLREKAPYDTWKDFVPITLAVKEPSVLLTNNYLPVKDLKALIALAKARPGELNYGVGGTGSTSNLASEFFRHMTGINIVKVTYKTAQQQLTELASGELQLTIIGAAAATPYMKSGRLRPLGISTAETSPLFPGVPTIASVAPGYEVSGMTALWAPAKTPDAIVRRLNQEIVRTLRQPDVTAKLASSGNDVMAYSPEEFAAWLKVDIAKMAKLIKDSGFKRD